VLRVCNRARCKHPNAASRKRGAPTRRASSTNGVHRFALQAGDNALVRLCPTPETELHRDILQKSGFDPVLIHILKLHVGGDETEVRGVGSARVYVAVGELEGDSSGFELHPVRRGQWARWVDAKSSPGVAGCSKC
jgi:hypothetical protein